MCCDCKNASFAKSVKPYRKFFRGKDLCLNRRHEDKKMDVRIEDVASGNAGVLACEFWRRPAAIPRTLQPEREIIMKTRHGKIARLPKETREQLPPTSAFNTSRNCP
jgi:hypothetical protein